MKQPFSVRYPTKHLQLAVMSGDPPASYDIMNWHVSAQGTVSSGVLSLWAILCPPRIQFHIKMNRVVRRGGSNQEAQIFASFFKIISLYFTHSEIQYMGVSASEFSAYDEILL